MEVLVDHDFLDMYYDESKSTKDAKSPVSVVETGEIGNGNSEATQKAEWLRTPATNRVMILELAELSANDRETKQQKDRQPHCHFSLRSASEPTIGETEEDSPIRLGRSDNIQNDIVSGNFVPGEATERLSSWRGGRGGDEYLGGGDEGRGSGNKRIFGIWGATATRSEGAMTEELQRRERWDTPGNPFARKSRSRNLGQV